MTKAWSSRLVMLAAAVFVASAQPARANLDTAVRAWQGFAWQQEPAVATGACRMLPTLRAAMPVGVYVDLADGLVARITQE